MRSRVSAAACAFAAERGARGGERQFVEHALLLVERAVDALDLLVGDDVGGARLERGEALVIGVLEAVEGAQEIVERLLDLAARAASPALVSSSMSFSPKIVIPAEHRAAMQGKGTQVVDAGMASQCLRSTGLAA